MKKIAVVVTDSSNPYANPNNYDKVLYASYAYDAMSWTDLCPSDDVAWLEYVRDVLFADDTDVVVDFYLDMSYAMSIPTAMGLMAAASRWKTIIGRLFVINNCRMIDMDYLIK